MSSGTPCTEINFFLKASSLDLGRDCVIVTGKEGRKSALLALRYRNGWPF